jgi:hypothetical protein
MLVIFFYLGRMECFDTKETIIFMVYEHVTLRVCTSRRGDLLTHARGLVARVVRCLHSHHLFFEKNDGTYRFCDTEVMEVGGDIL